MSGLYPLVGWKIGGETVYLAEGNAAGCGTAMEWAGKMGIYSLPFLTYSPPLSLTFCVFSFFLSFVLLIVSIISPKYLIALKFSFLIYFSSLILSLGLVSSSTPLFRPKNLDSMLA